MNEGSSEGMTEGGYYLVRAKATDERKNLIEAAQSFFGIGAGSATWKDSDRLQLDLALNKKEYKVGDKARLWIPEALAYKGRPGAPQGMLVFDVELLGIK